MSRAITTNVERLCRRTICFGVASEAMSNLEPIGSIPSARLTTGVLSVYPLVRKASWNDLARIG